jgi:hypothetical protein
MALTPPGTFRTVCPSVGPGCDFATVTDAVAASTGGDTIDVRPGTYSEQVSVDKPLTIQGHAGGARPVIESSGSGAGAVTFKIVAGGEGTSISHLELRALGSNSTVLATNGAGTVAASDLVLKATSSCVGVTGSTLVALTVAQTAGPADECMHIDGTTITDSTVDATGPGVVMSHSTLRRVTVNSADSGVRDARPPSGDPSVISDSVITATGSGRSAVIADGSPVPSTAGSLELRNVTAIATGAGSIGLEASGNSGPEIGGASPGGIDAKNVVARGIANDVVAQPAPACAPMSVCYAGSVTIDYSNFRTQNGAGPHNQSGDPLFANASGGDFHIAGFSSPLVAAGTDDPANGSTDRDGVTWPVPRSIGAYEYLGPRVRPGAELGTGAAGPAGALGTVADTVAPLFANASLTNTVFAVDSRGPTETLVAARKAKKGTRVNYTVSEASRVVFAIKRVQRGRRVGSKCRKPSRSNRKKAKCTRYALFGRFAQQAVAGANSKSWSGRIGRKKVKPGNYRATLTATDAAGNHSRPAQLTFRVVRR